MIATVLYITAGVVVMTAIMVMWLRNMEKISPVDTSDVAIGGVLSVVGGAVWPLALAAFLAYLYGLGVWRTLLWFRVRSAARKARAAFDAETAARLLEERAAVPVSHTYDYREVKAPLAPKPSAQKSS